MSDIPVDVDIVSAESLASCFLLGRRKGRGGPWQVLGQYATRTEAERAKREFIQEWTCFASHTPHLGE